MAGCRGMFRLSGSWRALSPLTGIVHTHSGYRARQLGPPIARNISAKVRLRSAQTQHVVQRAEENAPVPAEAPTPPASSTSGITLRPYQHTAINACLSALSSGLTRIGVSSPTGSGKTTMFMNLIPLIKAPGLDEKGQTLIIVGSVELANQAEGAAKRLLGPQWSVEVEQAKRVSSGRANVNIATYQTLNNIERLRKFDPAALKLVIVDEAHHAAAFSYLRLLHYFNDQVALPSMLPAITEIGHGHRVPIIGFSATFSRPDQLALSAVFEKIVFHREISAMLDDGWLAPARSTTVKCDLHLDQVELSLSGDYKASSLAHQVNTPLINDLILRTYLHRAKGRRSTLIFCVDLDHVANVTNAFRTAGVDARSVSSLSHPIVRKRIIEGFGKGEFPVLVNCEVLTEGTDIPQIDCIILARPTRSRNLLAQMVGRGLRLSPETGKEDCHIIDIVDSVNRANGMLVSPTLFGLSHDDLEEPEAREMEVEKREATAETELGDPASEEGDEMSSSRIRRVTYIDEDDPFGVGAADRLPIIVQVSNNAWVACGGDKFILELLGNGYIAIEPSTDPATPWSIKHHQKIPAELGIKAYYSRPRRVSLAEDLERAIQTADRYAEKRMGRSLALKLSRYAAWRSRPASQKAIAMLLKLKGVKEDALDNGEIELAGRMVPLDRLNAGQVSSYLCAANHGAATLRKKQEKIQDRALAKAQALAEKKRALAERNLPLPLPDAF